MAVILLFVVFFIIYKSGSKSTVLANWHQLFDIQFSSQEFYYTVEILIASKELKGVVLSRITYAEGGLLSARREYLRVQYKKYVFDICAAPFANEFFVSWWQSELSNHSFNFLARVPILNLFMIKRAKTFFEMDTENMFKESVKACVNFAVKQMTEPKGIRASDVV